MTPNLFNSNERNLRLNFDFKVFFILSFFIIGRIFSQSNNYENYIASNISFYENYEVISTIIDLSQEISGKVLDVKTGEVIPYCNIEVLDSQFGTSSNELGEFILQIDSLPVKIVFSHLNYERKVVEISETSNLNIQLTPLVNSLSEVVLAVNKKDKYAYELAEKAFSKTRKLSGNKNTVEHFIGRNLKTAMIIQNFQKLFMMPIIQLMVLIIGKF